MWTIIRIGSNMKRGRQETFPTKREAVKIIQGRTHITRIGRTYYIYGK